MSNTEKKSSSTLSTLDRTLDFLEILANSPEPMSAAEISNTMHITKATTYSMINSLLRKHYIERIERTGKYKLGYTYFKYGQLYSMQMDLFRSPAIYSMIVSSAKELGTRWNSIGNIFFTTDDGSVFPTIFIGSPDDISRTILFGIQAYAVAAGKIFLAQYPPEKLDLYFKTHSLIAYTPYTVIDEAKLREDFAQIREQGYAVTCQTMDVNVSCIAAPIYDASGKIRYAVSLTMQRTEMEKLNKQLDVIAEDVKQTADYISRQLGYIRPFPF